MSIRLDTLSERLSAGPSRGRPSGDPALRPEGDWFYGSMGGVGAAAGVPGFLEVNLPTNGFALVPASLLSVEAQPDGGATVTGWRESAVDAALPTGSLEEPLAATRLPTPEGGGLGPERPLQPVTAESFDSSTLFDEDSFELDFDRATVASGGEAAAPSVQGALPELEMLLPPGLDLRIAPISQAMLDSYWSGRPDPSASAGETLAWLDAGIVFDGSPPATGAAMEFVGFDSSQPTPIIASIEWGG